MPLASLLLSGSYVQEVMQDFAQQGIKLLYYGLKWNELPLSPAA